LLKGDSLRDELNKWSGMYWDVYQNHRGTIAGNMAVGESIRLLMGWNDKEMMKKVRTIQDEDALVELALSFGKDYMASQQGLNAALAYLDTLQNITGDDEKRMQIDMERIKLLYDSARVSQAQKKLTAFQAAYKDNKEAAEWAESISYDLNYLSPGDTIPNFEFTDNNRVISRESLLGKSYILEITALSNSLYQDQFDRTVVIQSIYKNYGLEIVTLPLDNHQITIDAFFEERIKPWPVSGADAFDRQELLERFNIRLIPTRFLVDRNGKIIRKYVGREYQDVIKDIQSLINQEKEPAS
jgi:glutathione peroxidase-family protein